MHSKKPKSACRNSYVAYSFVTCNSTDVSFEDT